MGTHDLKHEFVVLALLLSGACYERRSPDAGSSADAATKSDDSTPAKMADAGVSTDVSQSHPPGRADAAAGPTLDDNDAGGIVLECPHGGKVSAVHVEFHCGSITTYTCKDLSNVVLEFADGSRERFEGQSGHSNAFVGTGANAGKVVVRVWVKAGANQSGDGPGYGERIDAPEQTCEPPAAGSGGAGGTGEPCVVTPDGFCRQAVSGIGGHGAAGAAGDQGPQ